MTTALAAAGVDIAFCDNDGDAAERTRREVERLGRRVTAQTADALDPEQLADFFSTVDRDFDRLDILVNIVGGARRALFTETTPADWAEQIHRNFGWAIQSTSLAVPLLRAGGRGGSIISFTTIEAHRGAATLRRLRGRQGGPDELHSVTRRRARGRRDPRQHDRVGRDAERADHGDARGAGAPRTETMSPELRAQALAIYVPAGAPPSVDDLADVVLFLASDLARSVTGTTVHADGGTWASSGFLHWPGHRGWGPSPPADLFRDDL